MAVIVFASVYLRQRGSPESKPVAEPHHDWIPRLKIGQAAAGRCRRGFVALGVESPDAGVDLGSLVFVDPPGWYPFR